MSHFFAMMARMKLINRWPLMRNTQTENIAEHSLQVAMMAHALVVIDNQLFAGQLDPYQAATIALYHDASEILTGDLPTPIKYASPVLRDEYKKLERQAEQRLHSQLPKPLQDAFAGLLLREQIPAAYEQVLKDADVVCAYIKCLEELATGNHEFKSAADKLKTTLTERNRPALDYFIQTFVDSFSLTLDELSQEGE
jgi:5'-deoxynucleotidase